MKLYDEAPVQYSDVGIGSITMFSVATLNMWNVNKPFQNRMKIISEFVIDEAPEVFCLQEVPVFSGEPFFPPEFEEMGYSCTYLASGYFGSRAEGIAICTKSSSLLLGGILLSEGMDNRGRTALAVGIRDNKNGLKALAVTTHLTNGDNEAPIRQTQASEISRMISKIWSRFGKIPTVLTGDFNCTDDEGAIKLLVDSKIEPTLHDAQAEFGMANLNTLDRRNIFAADHPRGDRRIDYILLSEDLVLSDFRIIFNNVDNVQFASDHFGLYASCAFPL
jgi:endonuclease/exonuclease/phosphatase family metal-dependent hydrolase